MSQALFDYVETLCPCCNDGRIRQLGMRGGRAHRFGIGECVSVVRCERCGHIYPKPMPMLRDTNEGYQEPDIYFRYHDAGQKIERYKNLLKDLARRSGNTRARVLDIGSGCGEMLSAGRQLGLNISGVETSAVFAAFAHDHYDVEVNNCSLEKAGYPADSFDIAIMAAVIEHLYEPRTTLQEAWRVLRPGGLLWLDAPNEGSLTSRAANLYLHIRGKDWTSYLSPTFPPYHVQGFTPKSLKYLLEAVSFQLVDWRIFPAKTVWPYRRGLLVHFEYYAEMLVHAVERLAHTGSYMEALATKTLAGQTG